VAAEIQRCFEGADVLGYNALRFDVPLLAAEFARVNSDSSSNSGGGATASSTESSRYQVTAIHGLDTRAG
jgi:hypothetical protein